MLNKDYSTVFVSYSPDDRSIVPALLRALIADKRIEILKSPELSNSVDDWHRKLTSLIIRADAVMFVMTPKSLSSQVCRSHLECAAERNKRIVTAVGADVAIDQMPDALLRSTKFRFTNPDEFETSMPGFLAALKGAEPDEDDVPDLSVLDADEPLADEDDADIETEPDGVDGEPENDIEGTTEVIGDDAGEEDYVVVDENQDDDAPDDGESENEGDDETDELSGEDVKKIFISFSSRDRAFVENLTDSVADREPVEIYSSPELSTSLDEWRSNLEDLVAEADLVLFVHSRHSAVSEVCGWHLEIAEKLEKPVISVLAEEVADTPPPPLPKNCDEVSFVEEESFDEALDDFIDLVFRDMANAEALSQAISERQETRQAATDEETAANAGREETESATPPADPIRLFVSYSPKDRKFADELSEALNAENSLDLVPMPKLGTTAEQRAIDLEEAFVEIDTLLFVLSRHSVESEACGWHLEAANKLGKRIIVVFTEGIPAESAPAIIEGCTEVFFTRRDDFRAALAELMDHLNADIGWIKEHTRLGVLAREWDRYRRAGPQQLDGEDRDRALKWLAKRPAAAPPVTDLQRAFISAAPETARQPSSRRRAWIAGLAALAAVTVAGAGGAALVAYTENRKTTELRQELSAAAARETLIREASRAALERAEKAEAATTRTAQEKRKAEEDLARHLAANDGLVVEMARSLKKQTDVPKSAIVAALEDLEARQAQAELDAGGALERRHRRARALLSFIDAYLIVDEPKRALMRVRGALSIMQELVRQTPENRTWRRTLASIYQKAGTVYTEQGFLDEALAAFTEAQIVRERLVAEMPEDAKLRWDLSLSYDGVGNTQLAQGYLIPALESYRNSLRNFQGLSEADPENADWQHGMSVGHSKLAVVHLKMNDREKALAELKEGRAIAEKLALVFPDQNRWKRDLEWFESEITALEN